MERRLTKGIAQLKQESHVFQSIFVEAQTTGLVGFIHEKSLLRQYILMFAKGIVLPLRSNSDFGLIAVTCAAPLWTSGLHISYSLV